MKGEWIKVVDPTDEPMKEGIQMSVADGWIHLGEREMENILDQNIKIGFSLVIILLSLAIASRVCFGKEKIIRCDSPS